MARRLDQRQAPPQLAGQEVGLIEPALPQPVGMQWHRDNLVRGQALDHQPLREKERQRGRQPPPASVLIALDGELDRAFIRNCRAET
jgi:hypothetical protein